MEGKIGFDGEHQIPSVGKIIGSNSIYFPFILVIIIDRFKSMKTVTRDGWRLQRLLLFYIEGVRLPLLEVANTP